MSLTIWNVWDDGGSDAEERSHLLIAAATDAAAMEIWRETHGHTEDDAPEVTAKPAEWLWPSIPVPVASAPGVWRGAQMTEFGEAFRGFGFWDDGDPCCDECGDHVDEAHITSDQTSQICLWCAGSPP